MSHEIGHTLSSHIAAYVPVTGVPNPRPLKTRNLEAGTCMLDIRKRVLLMRLHMLMDSMQQRNNGAQCARLFDVHFNSSATASPNNSRVKIFVDGSRIAKTAAVRDAPPLPSIIIFIDAAL